MGMTLGMNLCVSIAHLIQGDHPRVRHLGMTKIPHVAVAQMKKSVFANPGGAWNDPDNDGAQLRVNPACDWLDIEVDANPGVAWSDPNNAVTQLLDEGVSGDDLVVQVDVDAD